jgi:hypothetical protein
MYVRMHVCEFASNPGHWPKSDAVSVHTYIRKYVQYPIYVCDVRL